MGKLNKKNEGIKPTVVNCMGEAAYAITPEEELVYTAMTTMLSDSYYEKEQEVIDRIKKCIDSVDPYFAAQTALYVRREGKLRSVTHLMASLLASKVSGKEWGGRFYEKIVMRPDDMGEILCCYAAINDKDSKNIKGLSHAIKKGFKAYLEKLDAYLIDKYRMPIFNLVRNLRNIIQHSPESVDEVCRQLVIPDKILKSRLLPFRFASAYKEIEQMGSTSLSDKDIVFESDKKVAAFTDENKKKVLNALEEAITISCRNLPILSGRSAILIDHSGSVRGDMGGSSKVSAFSETSHAVIGNLFGCMIASVLPDVFIGMFGDDLVKYDYDRTKGILWNNKQSFDKGSTCGPRTENGLFAFLNKCVDDNIQVDNLYIISDMQVGDGTKSVWEGTSSYEYGTFAKLLKSFKKINPNCKIISLNINGYGNDVFYRGSNILNISGWSESIFDVINEKFNGYKNIIDQIKKIKI